MVTETPFLRSPIAQRKTFALAAAALAAVAIALTLSATAAAATTHHHHHAPSPCAGASTPVAASTTRAMRASVVCLINQERTSRGLPALRADSRLDQSAQGWTNKMVSHHEFTHGANFSERISASGFRWLQAGENIASGFPTPTSVVAGWMASASHCQNILSPTFREVGTGVSRGATVLSPGTWTQDFGLLMGEHPASGNGAPAAGCPYR